MNIQQMMKQAQAMQKEMQELQEQSEKQFFDAQVGGGLVKITIDGKGECKKIDIAPSILTPEDKELLQDLIIAGFNEAKNKANAAQNDSLTNNFGGMLPPGFKFPF